MTDTILDLDERVRAGIAKLEEHTPGCTDKIDLETLDAWELDRCPLAQAIGDGSYHVGLHILDIGTNDNAAAAYGFALRYDESTIPDDDGMVIHQDRYRQLNETWVRLLTEYREAKA